MKAFIALFIFLFFVVSCKKNESSKKTNADVQQTLFSVIPNTSSGIDFMNRIVEDEDINYLHYGYIYNGAGVAAGDINNDGLVDLYFSSNLEYNKLYLNQGNFKFKDITESAGVDGGTGYKSGVTMVDINNDGWLDIFVCKTAIKDSSFRKKMLYINNGDGTFTDKIKEYGLDDRSYTTQAYFFDSDNDGDLDVYFVNHPMNFEDNNYIKPIISTQKSKGPDVQFTSDRLYENKNGYFRDISEKAHLINEAFGLSAVVGDFNNDRLTDIYVANDFLKPDYLYINQGNNSFKEEFDLFFQHCSFSSMGTDFADINNDGCPDLMVVDMTPLDNYRQKTLMMTQNYDRFQLMLKSGLKAQFSINCLQLGSCGSRFSDIAFLSNTAYTDWSWSPLFADFDNDGYKDLFVTNGYLHDVMHADYNKYKLDSLEKLHIAGKISQVEWINQIPSVKTKDYLFRNNKNLQFIDESAGWNSGPSTFSSGACYADLDNDGDLDLVVNNVNDYATLLQNNTQQTAKRNFIRFECTTDKSYTNEGVQVTLTLSDHSIQTQSLNQTRGFLSKVEEVLHFGLDDKTVLEAQIKWKDQKSITLKNPELNKVYKINHKDAKKVISQAVIQSIFKESAQSSTALLHQENEYIDFKREPLLINKLSEEGPATAVADINGDGLDDIYIGGSKSYSGSLYIQNENETFNQVSIPAFQQDKDAEDVAALFFDSNGDKLPDLYVVSGGNESVAGDKSYQDRLYINKGNEQFALSNLLPEETNSGSCICSSDIDGDGDIDLFVGSRCVPGKYPTSPDHLLLINNQGSFLNLIQKLAPELNSVGMICAAQFADLDNDHKDELIVAGEFTPICIFKMKDGKFENVTTAYSLQASYGLWKSLYIEDLNNDGFKDIVAGNTGLNTYFKASPEQPIELYYSDFDKNGTVDPILCQYNGSKSYPIVYRDRLLDQMVILKKKFTRYEPYAKATLNDIFNEDQLKNSKKLFSSMLESKILMSDHGKSFVISNLPIQAQFSSLNASLSIDYNHDGTKDLITTGNFYGSDAQYGRADASISCLLKGTGNMQYDYIAVKDGGLNISGNVKSILTVKTKNGIKYVFTKNNDTFSIVQLVEKK